MPLKIAVIPGDGIGPEVIGAGIQVLQELTCLTSFTVDLQYFPHGAHHYLNTRETLSDETLADLLQYDAIYLGAVGDPRVKPGVLEMGFLLPLRTSLDLYVNLRPVKLLSYDFSPLKKDVPIDMVVIRENTEGLYCGSGGFLKKGTDQEIATQEMINTYRGVERIIRYAFAYAQKKGRKKVTLCDKANVLVYAHDLWRRVFETVKREYENMETQYCFVDAMTMTMVREPQNLDVIVTCNLFGDIISDLGAELQGGLGVAASANLHPGRLGVFEPVHGSAPDIAGEGIANPIAAIQALALLLQEQGYLEEGKQVEEAVYRTLLEGNKPLSMGGRLNCQEMTRAIIGNL